MNIRHWVRITSEEVVVNGMPLATENRGSALLTEIYRKRVNDYPKFFKMDELSKLGFLATELLLKSVGDRHADSEDRAVILFGRNGSLCSDCKFEQTIANAEEFFPSPSVFVYTLPNIVTGEIAIRNRYYGETAFYMTGQRDEQLMRQTADATLADGSMQSAIWGWVDCGMDEQFEVYVALITK